MGKTYNLFLDDVRKPIDVYLYTYRPEYKDLLWDIAKNYDEFTTIFSTKYANGDMPRVISLDHDLTKEHYLLGSKSAYMYFNEVDVKEPTGWHVLMWIINFYETNDIELPNIMIHSKNPAGTKNMKKLLSEYENRRNLKWNFNENNQSF